MDREHYIFLNGLFYSETRAPHIKRYRGKWVLLPGREWSPTERSTLYDCLEDVPRWTIKDMHDDPTGYHEWFVKFTTSRRAGDPRPGAEG